MSGGVDSAVAAQLALDAGDDVVAVTLELWADPATDGDAELLLAPGRSGARALAHRMGIPHLTLDLREPLRRRGRRPTSSPSYAAGAHAQPVRALQRPASASTRCSSWPRRSARRGSPPATTRASPATTDGPLLAPRADPRKDQTYMLAALEPAELERSVVPARRLTKAERARSSPATPGCRWPTSARARTSASSPASAARAFLQPPRRAAPAAPWRDRRRRGTRARRATTVSTTSRSASGAASGSSGAEPLYVLAKDAEANRVVVGPRERLATSSRAARRRAPPPRPRRRRDRAAALPLRADRVQRRRRPAATASARCSSSSARRSRRRPRPARVPDAVTIAWWGTERSGNPRERQCRANRAGGSALAATSRRSSA